MKIAAEIYLMAFLVMYACNHKGINCIEETVESFAAKTEFNYFDFASEFEEYLIENQILLDENKEAWISMFQNRNYCKINYDHFISAVDNSFSTSPTIGGAFVSCGKENEFFVELSPLSGVYVPRPSRLAIRRLKRRISISGYPQAAVPATYLAQITGDYEIVQDLRVNEPTQTFTVQVGGKDLVYNFSELLGLMIAGTEITVGSYLRVSKAATTSDRPP